MKSLDKKQVTGSMFRMRIRRYNKPAVILYYRTTEDIKIFNEFIENLIANVKGTIKKRKNEWGSAAQTRHDVENKARF